MSELKFESVSPDDLSRVSGGFSASQMPSSARWIMQHESAGRTSAKNPHSTAFGAFQMLKANRKHYQGAQWQSTDLGVQYAAASHYVKDRYGSWDRAKAFWQSHHWY